MASVAALAKAAIVSGIIRSITGADPEIVDKGNVVTIELPESQKEIFRKKITELIEAGPGDVSLDLVDLAGPVLLKKLWWVVGAPLGIGFLAGYMIRDRQ